VSVGRVVGVVMVTSPAWLVAVNADTVRRYYRGTSPRRVRRESTDTVQ
jgi:hypothetical protein